MFECAYICQILARVCKSTRPYIIRSPIECAYTLAKILVTFARPDNARFSGKFMSSFTLLHFPSVFGLQQQFEYSRHVGGQFEEVVVELLGLDISNDFKLLSFVFLLIHLSFLYPFSNSLKSSYSLNSLYTFL